jgi:hypothetical protein
MQLIAIDSYDIVKQRIIFQYITITIVNLLIQSK